MAIGANWRRPHTVASDPGTEWVKNAEVAIDAPPDAEIDPAPEARWPSDAARCGVYGAVTPTVVELPDGGYRMYYTQILPRPGFPQGANDYDNATTRILSAISEDGVAWTPEAGVRLSARQGGAGEFRVVAPEIVPLQDGSGRLRMYFECCPGSQPVASGIRSAISEDGLAWTVEPGDRLSGNGGSYNAPRVLFLDEGTCRLYCSDRAEGIVSAVSDDGGFTFRLESGRRIVRELSYEAQSAFAPEVLLIDGGGFRMYYAGYSKSTRAYILTAVSDDGLRWHKEPEPVIAPGGRYDRAKCSELGVVRLPEVPGKAPGYCMFYEACDGTAADERGVWRILSATSAVSVGPGTTEGRRNLSR